MTRYPTLQHTLQVVQSIYPEATRYILDIGAQRKTPFLMQECTRSLHHLFEPVTTYHEDLETNYAEAGIDYVLHRVALSDETGIAYLHNYSEDHSGKITHSYIDFSEAGSHRGELISIEEVPVVTLDSFFREDPLPDYQYLVKLDVDGLEEKIISGGKHVVSRASFIIIEASLGRRNLVSRIQLVEELGYRLFDICDHAYYFGQMSQCDLVLINEEVRRSNEKFRPWERANYKVEWANWQHGFRELEEADFHDPFASDEHHEGEDC